MSTVSSLKAPFGTLISFDQWGVELGKALAVRIIPEIETGAKCHLKHDSSTNTLIQRYTKSKDAIACAMIHHKGFYETT